jgi:NDP-sugar pyrophosphorylase family protein
MSKLYGVIPAAGRGVRAYPYTRDIPKCMLEVDGVPLIRQNVELMRDRLGIREIRIVIGHHGEVIREQLRDGSTLGVNITYIENDRLDLELAYSVFLGCRGLASPCCVILADECYVGTNHEELLRSEFQDAFGVCGVVQAQYAKEVRKNYSVSLDAGRIVDMHEKPSIVTNNLMGTGTYLLSAAMVERLEAAFAGGPTTGPRVFTTWLAELCRQGSDIRPLLLQGGYVNVNSRDDLNYGNLLVRERTFSQRKVSLVYVVDDENNRLDSIERFAERPEIDEVIVVFRQHSPEL